MSKVVANVIDIAISYEQDQKKSAEALSRSTGISLNSAIDQPTTFLLHLGTSELQLKFTPDPSLKPLYIDFLSGKNQHRRMYGGGKGQQLAKAIGLNKYKNPTVIDTTAGLGKDAFVLASLGCHVTLLERTLAVYLLLNDALSRASHSDDPAIQQILQNMLLRQVDSLNYLSSLKQTEYPDVIYIDPMFPPREKSAKVKKEMALFHHLVGQDNDAQQLIECALPRALKRIVVKRPRLADCLYPDPAFQITGKSTRYDIYLPKPLSDSH